MGVQQLALPGTWYRTWSKFSFSLRWPDSNTLCEALSLFIYRVLQCGHPLHNHHSLHRCAPFDTFNGLSYFFPQMWVGPALLRFLTVAFLWSVPAAGQSNYASHGNNVEYQGEGLPEKTVLDGKVIKLDDLSPLIFLNRTKATLNCVAGSMQVS